MRILNRTLAIPTILQLGFFFSNLYFFVYLKEKLREYLVVFQSFSPDVASLKNIAVNSTADIARASSVILPLEKATNEAVTFAFFIAPLVVLLLWIIFQSSIWFLLRSSEIKDKKKFFLDYSIISAVIIAPYLYLLYQLLQTEFTYVESNVILIIGLTFAGYVLLTLYSISISGASLKSDLASAFRRRNIKTIPWIALLFVVSTVLFFLFATALASKSAGEYILSPTKLFGAVIIASIVDVAVKKIACLKCGSKDLNLRRR